MKLGNKKYQNQIINEYIEYLDAIRGYSKNTIIAYKTDLLNYFQFINTYNKNYYDIEKYIQHLSKNKYKKTTINRKINTIINFLKWCKSYKNINIKEIKNIKNLRTEKKLPTVLTSSYINKLLDSIPISTTKDVRDRSIIELLYSSGLRLSELTNLKLNDIKNNQSIKVTGKGNKVRILPMTNKSYKILDLWINTYRSNYEIKESENRLREVFKRMKGGAGIYRAIDEGDDFIIIDHYLYICGDF